MSSRTVQTALVSLFFASALFAQVTERIDVTAIEVPVVVRDAKGGVPPDLKPSDFVLLEDGKPQQIIGVAYSVKPLAPLAGTTTVPLAPIATEPVPAEKRWQVVIYIQQSLSSSHGLSEALKSLATHAGELTALGDVQIVSDEGGTARVIASATSDGETLRKTILDLAPKIRGQEEITRLRSMYIAEAGPPKVDVGSTNKARRDPNALRALATARLEAQIVRARQDVMLTWTARYQELGRPHALVVVTSGYDVEPHDFYAASDGSTDADLHELSSSKRQAEIAQAMTAAGWTILSFAPGWMDNALSPTFDVTNAGRGRLNDFVRNPDPRGSVATPVALNLHPLEPLRTMAEESGGSVATNTGKLTSDLDDLANRIVVTYQLHRVRDGRSHRIVVKSLRAGLTVRTQRSVVSGTPEALAMARASLLSANEGERGELSVRCAVSQVAASNDAKELTSALDIFVTLTPIDAVRAGLTAGTLRFSVSVRTPDAPPVTISKRMEGLDLSKQANWRIDFKVQHRPGATVGVVAEEMATGAWGGTKCGAH